MTVSERRLGLLDLAVVTATVVGLLLLALTHVLDVRSDDDYMFASDDFCCDCSLPFDPTPDCWDRTDRGACLRDEIADQVDAYLSGTDVGHRPIPYRR